MIAAGEQGQVRIALTISGAVSLGAYEGGALAALLAAVQAVNEQRPGALRVDAMAGASAGSITALVAARALTAGLDPIDAMYRAWVVTPQLDELRDHNESPLSVDRTRDESESILGADEDPSRVQPGPIKVSMALGCLRGLNYSIGRIGGPPISASTYLDWADFTIDDTWTAKRYGDEGALDAALASGAHAAAFPPYGLERSSKEVLDAYERKHVENPPPSQFLWYTDGGTIDNEPLGRALDLTEDLDGPGEQPVGAARRIHMLITPDPARPPEGDGPWATRQPAPTWARTGLRTIKLVRQQRLYDDLRRVEKTNSRIEWTRLLVQRLVEIIERPVDRPEQVLEEVTAEIATQRKALQSNQDLRHPESEKPDSQLALALREALDAATGLAKKKDVTVAVVSPVLLPELVADPNKTPHDLLAGEFLGHFGGFLAQRLRENDFSVGYRSMLTWLEGEENPVRRELGDVLGQAALEGAKKAATDRTPDNSWPWTEDLGDFTLKKLPFRQRVKLYLLGLRAGWIAFSQVRKGPA
jgi:predicted acylesterase/phospholipase RssA